MNEKIKKLTELCLSNKNNKDFPYLKISNDNKYSGWVSNFNLSMLSDNSQIKLNLNNEKDLFLLFVMASAWSKTGPWENAVFFTTYIKLKQNWEIEDWQNNKYIETEAKNNNENCKNTFKQVTGIQCHKTKEPYFREDFYNSVKILANNWQTIKIKLDESNKKRDWKIFIEYISSIEGLGTGKNKMRIKIPLILRELKCQNIYNIDGRYCCVADKRVRDTYNNYIGEKLPSNYIKASEVIWNDFKELYDIPAFAYPDFLEKNLI
ncbi:MAG: hypothetical protein MRZ46_08865 [Oscillospiraceae bacterium]|nr:hypothetical protein [Oscillospiraceae bacterium]